MLFHMDIFCIINWVKKVWLIKQIDAHNVVNGFLLKKVRGKTDRTYSVSTIVIHFQTQRCHGPYRAQHGFTS